MKILLLAIATHFTVKQLGWKISSCNIVRYIYTNNFKNVINVTLNMSIVLHVSLRFFKTKFCYLFLKLG